MPVKQKEAQPGQHLQQHGRPTLIADIGSSLTTKVGSLFALSAEDGDFDDVRNPGYGLYFHDTRFLKRETLRLAGHRLSVLLAHADRAESVTELSNPQIELGEDQMLNKEMLAIRRHRRLGEHVTESIDIVNYGSDPVDVPLQLDFDADFENMFTVRGADEGKRGTLHRPQWHGSSLRFRYDGADDHQRTTTVHLDPSPDDKHDRCAEFRLQLKSGQGMTIKLRIDVKDQGPQDATLEHEPPSLHPSDAPSWARVQSSNPLFDRTIQRSLADLEMLTMRERGDIFFAGGVPWYVALFGRDSIITAIETLAYEPRIAANTLELLAKYQGTKEDKWREEEPGKILHELRVGEKANLNEVPQTPYYGTVDATPLFIILAGEYVRWTGDLELWRRLRPNIDRALGWIESYGDSDGDGFTDYRSTSHKGMDNQGWKDSGNSVRNRDGSLATPPIALVEVQGYVYRAKLTAAGLFRHEGDEARATKLEDEAAALRKRFRPAYWMEDRGTLAEALQKDGRQAEAITSNPGQALWGGIVDPDHAQAVAKSLMSPAMSTGWGIRTLAEGEAAYNPVDYQVGSVWPHDNALIAHGLKQYGFLEEAVEVFTSIYHAATLFSLYRLPEVFSGFSSKQYPRPVRYPVACNPQAWAAGSLPYLLQTALGLEPNALDNRLDIVNPRLPDFLEHLTISGVRVGGACVDLRYVRSRDATLVAVAGRTGELDVRIQY